jgi:hypothetical protein
MESRKADEDRSVVMGKGGAIAKEAGRTRRSGCCADRWSTTHASRDTRAGKSSLTCCRPYVG